MRKKQERLAREQEIEDLHDDPKSAEKKSKEQKPRA
jgi:hypothetical protein